MTTPKKGAEALEQTWRSPKTSFQLPKFRRSCVPPAVLEEQTLLLTAPAIPGGKKKKGKSHREKELTPDFVPAGGKYYP